MSKCGCGRSPSGNCVGWHNLTEEQYLEKKLFMKKSNLLNDFFKWGY